MRLGIDAQTLEIRAIEITDNAIGDAPMLPVIEMELEAAIPIAADFFELSRGSAGADTSSCTSQARPAAT